MKFRILLSALLLAAGPLFAQTTNQPPPVQPNTVELIRPTPQPEMMDLIPALPVKDLRKAVDFYTNKLGFSIVLLNGNTYAAVARDVVQIGLALNKYAAASSSKASYYINMSEVDIYYKELLAKSVKITREIKTQPSKMREFAVTDPDGNMIIFGEYTGGR